MATPSEGAEKASSPFGIQSRSLSFWLRWNWAIAQPGEKTVQTEDTAEADLPGCGSRIDNGTGLNGVHEASRWPFDPIEFSARLSPDVGSEHAESQSRLGDVKDSKEAVTVS